MEVCKICNGASPQLKCVSDLGFRDILLKGLSNLSKLIEEDDCICEDCQLNLEKSFKFLTLKEEKVDKGVTVLYSGEIKKSVSQIMEVGNLNEKMEENTNQEDMESSDHFNNEEMIKKMIKMKKRAKECKNRCIHCLKCFTTAKKLNHHIQLIQYPLTCKLCHSVLETRNQLNLHCKINCTGENILGFPRLRKPKKTLKLNCKGCHKVLKRLRSTKNLSCQSNPCKVLLSQEITEKNKHGNVTKSIKCGICFKRFNSEQKFRIHSMMHISYYNNCKCSYCGINLQQVLRRLSQAYL